MNIHDRKTLHKILEHAEHLMLYTRNCESLEAFSADTMLTEACVFNLVQIGELAHSELSDEIKSEIKGIPWRQIYGMRNRIVHGYSSVNLMVVWETIRDDIGPLAQMLQEVLDHDNEM